MLKKRENLAGESVAQVIALPKEKTKAPGQSPAEAYQKQKDIEDKLKAAYQTFKHENKGADKEVLVTVQQLIECYTGRFGEDHISRYCSAVSAIGALIDQNADSKVCALVEKLSGIYDAHVKLDDAAQSFRRSRDMALEALKTCSVASRNYKPPRAESSIDRL